MIGNSNLSLSLNIFCFWIDFSIIPASFFSPRSTVIYLGDNIQVATS